MVSIPDGTIKAVIRGRFSEAKFPAAEDFGWIYDKRIMGVKILWGPKSLWSSLCPFFQRARDLHRLLKRGEERPHAEGEISCFLE